MNYELFSKAQSLYDAKDFQGALMAFTQCLQDEAMPPAPGETGRLYHQIGNCLIELRDANEAIQAYTQAVADPAYDMKGRGRLQSRHGICVAPRLRQRGALF